MISSLQISQTFCKLLASRLATPAAEIENIIPRDNSTDGGTTVAIRGSSGVFYVSIVRAHQSANPQDFLLLLRTLSVVFPSLGIENARLPQAERHCIQTYRVREENDREYQISFLLEGQLSDYETHYMRWFILSQMVLEGNLIVVREQEVFSFFSLEIVSIGMRYILSCEREKDIGSIECRLQRSETLSRSIPQRDLSIIGTVSFPLVEIANLSPGSVIVIPLSENMLSIDLRKWHKREPVTTSFYQSQRNTVMSDGM